MSNDLFDQWSSCTAVIRDSVGSKPIYLKGEADQANDSDIIQGTIDKDIHSPCGNWSLTLKPSQEYLDKIKPNDWIEIYLDNGDGTGPHRAMYGLVDQITRSRQVGGRGEESLTIRLSGRDWGKALASTGLVFDPTAKDVGLFAKILERWSQGLDIRSPGETIRFLLESLLGIGTQFLGPSGRSIGDSYVADIDAGFGSVSINTSLSLNGSLWELLETYAVPAFNELFTDWSDTGGPESSGSPILRFRKIPFLPSDFADLPSFHVPYNTLTGEEVSKADHDVKNWFRVSTDLPGLTELTLGNTIGMINAKSVIKHGLRKMEITTNGLFPPTGYKNRENGDVISMIKEATSLIAHWYGNNENLLSGSFSSGLLVPTAKVGQRLIYKNSETVEDLQFYCEAYHHNFNYSESAGSETSFSVTRGSPLIGAVEAELTELSEAYKNPNFESLIVATKTP